MFNYAVTNDAKTGDPYYILGDDKTNASYIKVLDGSLRLTLYNSFIMLMLSIIMVF